ncbi:AzlD domain-containing protein [Herbiconiux sp. CPCC 205716]|uniref:AzlD domain-containing protein n=1 Tax=Herbiconiux gentiana TaxID=2970912 RepID=A0ABT2GJ93_9MICO|nr:AzlD domain-containing protein [Herbiconiux gentiana]MCS5714979.1 AzlD domain-containing protein [Herbiconiux gentiana]
MTAWQIVILASIVCVALKVAGYLIPPKAFEHPTVARIANLMTVALLAALIGVQTLGVGQAIQVDARVPAVLVAAVLYALRVPFVVVVIAAALVAAGIRMLT